MGHLKGAFWCMQRSFSERRKGSEILCLIFPMMYSLKDNTDMGGGVLQVVLFSSLEIKRDKVPSIEKSLALSVNEGRQ